MEASYSDYALPDRAETRATLRAQLRTGHRHLTEEQVDLIADVAVELRMVSIRLASQTFSFGARVRGAA